MPAMAGGHGGWHRSLLATFWTQEAPPAGALRKQGMLSPPRPLANTNPLFKWHEIDPGTKVTFLRKGRKHCQCYHMIFSLFWVRSGFYIVHFELSASGVGRRDGEAVNSGVKSMSWAASSLGVKPGSATCSLCHLSRLRFPSLWNRDNNIYLLTLKRLEWEVNDLIFENGLEQCLTHSKR